MLVNSHVANLFDLLWQLHRIDLVHGDPRVPNVIVHDGKLLWIDLAQVMRAIPALRKLDAEILAKSILYRQVELPTEPPELIAAYGMDPTQDNMKRLAARVGKVFEPWDTQLKDSWNPTLVVQAIPAACFDPLFSELFKELDKLDSTALLPQLKWMQVLLHLPTLQHVITSKLLCSESSSSALKFNTMRGHAVRSARRY
ncbi:hypothetical protein AC1031_002250 [Aphanomyces cochlioides]|nr:hypothetical protein AC1031_002250 [Aphanomyces cochlioides]